MVDLASVAATYKAAVAEGQHGTKAVQDELGVSRSTAGRHVAAARAAGLLSEDPRPVNLKAGAVADALGVSYEALLAAIAEHAGGDLRVLP